MNSALTGYGEVLVDDEPVRIGIVASWGGRGLVLPDRAVPGPTEAANNLLKRVKRAVRVHQPLAHLSGRRGL